MVAMDSNGLSDPFCVVRVNNAKKFKTNVAYETLSPVWNESVSIAMPQEGDKISFVSLFLYIDAWLQRGSMLFKEDGLFRQGSVEGAWKVATERKEGRRK